MMKCKVSSGEFELIVAENSLLAAANIAIKIHDQQERHTKLGDLTLVEQLCKNNLPTGEHLFIDTVILIENNTKGFGVGDGQYIRRED